jgi:actin-related protein 6
VPKEIVERYLEMVFEDFGFDALYMGTCGTLSLEKAKEDIEDLNSDAQLVVDCGYSFTWVIPHLFGFPINYGSRRIDVGGKMLSNLIKQIISYRHFNISDEKIMVDHLKEVCCRVSSTYNDELIEFKNKTHADLKMEFVLPDYVNDMKGFIRQRPTEVTDAITQSIPCDHSMIAIPEILFNPSHIEIYQAGIPEVIYQSISKCPSAIQSLLYENIVLTGGTSLLNGVAPRIKKELIKWAPVGQKINIHPMGIYSQWEGLKLKSLNESISQMCITKKQYQEFGNRCTYKFIQ